MALLAEMNVKKNIRNDCTFSYRKYLELASKKENCFWLPLSRVRQPLIHGVDERGGGEGAH